MGILLIVNKLQEVQVMDWEIIRKYRTATSEIYILILDGEEVGTVNIHFGKELHMVITTILELEDENKDDLIEFIREAVLDSIAIELDDELGIEVQFYSKGEVSTQLIAWEDFFYDLADDEPYDLDDEIEDLDRD